MVGVKQRVTSRKRHYLSDDFVANRGLVKDLI